MAAAIDNFLKKTRAYAQLLAPSFYFCAIFASNV